MFRLDKVERLLIGAIAVMFFTGALLLWASPRWWGWYLRVLDARYWKPWMWIGAFVALADILLMIRLWPNEKRRRPDNDPKMPSESP